MHELADKGAGGTSYILSLLRLFPVFKFYEQAAIKFTAYLRKFKSGSSLTDLMDYMHFDLITICCIL